MENLSAEILKCAIAKSEAVIANQGEAVDLGSSFDIVCSEKSSPMENGVEMAYGLSVTPFGVIFVAAVPMGLCALQFVDNNFEEIWANHCRQWPDARHVRNDHVSHFVAGQLFGKARRQPYRLYLKGTSFQQKVWKALLTIPMGMLVTYGMLARIIRQERAVRAVASAVASNPVSLIVPCHRVIRSEGVIGQYRWKSERKAALIAWEFSLSQSPQVSNP